MTSDVDTRLEWHNHGPCGHTLNDRPWSLVVVLEFPTEREAVRFERYLKSGSGRAFTKQQFGPRRQLPVQSRCWRRRPKANRRNCYVSRATWLRPPRSCGGFRSRQPGRGPYRRAQDPPRRTPCEA
ncbi:MAG: GIY-YIG nuclease family protein [Vicinamibacterales bacterium]